ncbi:MAG: hypothetical protein OEZ68_15290 [Gammaproteobacteria bacterium]|nr:hypothetical protein [Gammaproteobacteria bacterium]MDH5802165.1 hypothetical protein [Gammaproteobacteria bacterium]
MANRAYLYSNSQNCPPDNADSEQLLGSNYFIPALWLACMQPGDLKHRQASQDEEEMYYFSLAAASALSRCRDRLSSLEMFVDNIDEYFLPWEAFLEELADKYIQIDVSEIIWQDEEALTQLQSSLGFLDEPNEQSAEDFMCITCLNDVYSEENNSVIATPGPTVEELTGEADKRRLPDRDVNTYMLGYPIADWVSWSSDTHKTQNANDTVPLTTMQRFSWHPLVPFICFTFVLSEVLAEASGFSVTALVLTGVWLALAIYNLATGGKFTAWLYHHSNF